MKVFLMLILYWIGLYGYSPKDFQSFNTPLPTAKQKIIKKECYLVCQKQLQKVELIDKALHYYKTTSYHSFSSSKKRSK
ncbi:MAG: hypothetical protein GXO11_04785 [Epsilonproteobacteria bacterium]|nr:hypothetical protein [Campylobacterota bacterium]